MIGILQIGRGGSRAPMVIACFLLLGLIGSIDYVTGFQLFFSVFYLLGVGLAAWFVGRGFGFVMSALSVVVWIGGDLAAGARYSNPLVPIWNAVILAVFYGIVVWLLAYIRSLQTNLESRVRERTQDLEKEMAERRRLQEEILKVAEREQRRISYDLHDGLCQHLTATALAGEVLSERLASKSVPEAADAREVVELVEEGINLARNFARGLSPVEMEAEGLMAAFQELATNTNRGTRIECVFECVSPVLIHDNQVATQLFRIAQEAVSNAVRHGRPKRIGISLSEEHGRAVLRIEDDGVGLAEKAEEGSGLGIRIMAYRASIIGSSFGVEPAPTGGTIVTCTVPLARSINAKGVS